MFPGPFMEFENNKNNSMGRRKGDRGRLREVAIYWRITLQ